jgi:hypothetical protein
VGVAGVGLALAGMQVSDPAHRETGQVLRQYSPKKTYLRPVQRR